MTLIFRLYTHTRKYVVQLILGVLMLALMATVSVYTLMQIKNIVQFASMPTDTQYVWCEVPHSNQTVNYDGKYYIQKTASTCENTQTAFQFVWENEQLYKKSIDSETKTVFNRQDLASFYAPGIPWLVQTIATLIIVNIIAGIFSYFGLVNMRMVAQKVTRDLRYKAFDKMQTLSIDYYSKEADGRILSYLTNDTEAVKDLYEQFIFPIVNVSVNTTALLIGLFFIEWRAGIAMLFILPIVYFWINTYRKKSGYYYELERSANADINAMVNEAASGVSVIQAFTYEQHMENSFEKINEKYYDARNRRFRIVALLEAPMVHMLQRILIVLIVLFSGVMLFNWNTSQSVVVALLYIFIEYINRLSEPLWLILQTVSVLERVRVSANRVFIFLDEEEEVVDSTLSVEKVDGNVTFENVRFGYNKEYPILKDISFAIPAGSLVGVVGHTGSGKSTLMNILMKFYDYDAGRVLIDGKELRALSKHQYRSHLGIVLQDPELFEATLYENVVFDQTHITREEVIETFERIGGGRMLSQFKNGLDEMIIDEGSNLSLGERQLINFARAIIKNPAIMILDEATANIDTDTESMIQHALNVVKENRTTFVIAHRLSTILDADIILVMDNGELKEVGTHHELLEQQGIYAKMYEASLNM